MKKQKIIAVVGPTASGKSDLAVEIALWLESKQMQKEFGIAGAEIISADSRQVYRGMNIGTGKITEKEMKNIPHYLLDVANPRHRFTVAQYRQRALTAIKKIQKKKKVPIICGGTGFYIHAVVDGLIIPEVKPDLQLRQSLEKLATEEIFAQLKKLDSRRARDIDRFNRRRLIRALEIILKTNKPVQPIRLKSDFQPLFIGIKKSKAELSALIKKRLLKRLRVGMIAEVKKMRKKSVSWKRLEEFGLEYRYIAYFLQDKISRQEMIKTLQKKIEQYAKRQLTWFKRDKRIYWIKNKQKAFKLIKNFLD